MSRLACRSVGGTMLDQSRSLASCTRFQSPCRAARHVAAHLQDRHREHGAEQEPGPPPLRPERARLWNIPAFPAGLVLITSSSTVLGAVVTIAGLGMLVHSAVGFYRIKKLELSNGS